jgi:hypothetical protein
MIQGAHDALIATRHPYAQMSQVFYNPVDDDWTVNLGRQRG